LIENSAWRIVGGQGKKQVDPETGEHVMKKYLIAVLFFSAASPGAVD